MIKAARSIEGESGQGRHDHIFIAHESVTGIIAEIVDKEKLADRREATDLHLKIDKDKLNIISDECVWIVRRNI